MKIEQLLDNVRVGEARAGGALSTRAASQAAGQQLGKNIAAGLPQADANAAIAQARKTVAPAASAAAPSLNDRLAQFKAAKAQTEPAPKAADVTNPKFDPAAAGTDVGAVVPGADKPETVPATTTAPDAAAQPKKTFMQRAGDAAQGLSNIIQKGAANAKDNIPAIANYAGDLAQNTAPGLGRVATATGDLAQNVGTGIQGVGGGIEKGLKGVGNVVRGIGDVGKELVGGVTGLAGAVPGGFKRGYDQTSGGGKLAKSINSAIPRYSATSGGGAGGAGAAGGGDEIADLKQQIAAMDQRLRRIGAE